MSGENQSVRERVSGKRYSIVFTVISCMHSVIYLVLAHNSSCFYSVFIYSTTILVHTAYTFHLDHSSVLQTALSLHCYYQHTTFSGDD
ncbi:hypothetical protein STEG23_024136, partial [Scotinomys teguina]